MTRLLIVEDHPLFREGLQTAILSFDPSADVFEATSIEAAMDVIAAAGDLDLVLLDLSLPGTTGFSGLLRIRAAHPKLPVVVVSAHEEPALVSEALSLGIAGYVPKSTPRAELARAIQDALAGSIYVPQALLKEVNEVAVNEREMLNRLRDLTPQQLLVLEMVREGKQNKLIAYELNLAETTVKAHVSEILRKLRVYSRTQAVVQVAKVDFKTLRKS